jgi:hypothetical protein
MNTRFLLAGLAGGLTAFMFGWLLFGVLLMDVTAGNVVPYEGLMKGPDMEFPPLVLSNLLLGFLLAWLGLRMHITTATGGLVMGAIVGFLFYASVDLSFLAMMNFFTSVGAALFDVVANTVWTAVIAAVACAVLGRGAKAA